MTTPRIQSPGGAAASPEGNVWSQMAPEEYAAGLQRDLNRIRAEEDQAVKPKPHPVAGFWSRLGTSFATFMKLPGTETLQGQQTRDIVSGVGRGLAGAANNMARTAFEFGAFVDRHTGLGEAQLPGYNAAYDEAGGARGMVDAEDASIVDDTEMVATYGARSDDPLAAFAETTSQFVAGMALARGAGVGNIYLQGAVADAAFFDPYEAQLAELVARAPAWTGVGLVGQLLTVEGDDSALVARIKRSAAGAIAGGLIDGLIAGTRWIRGQRTLANPASTVAEKSAAQSTVDQAGATLQTVADAQHVAADEHIVVRSTPDGNFHLEGNPKSPVGSLLERRSTQNMETPTFQRRTTDAPQPASRQIQQVGAPEQPLTPPTLEESARQADLAVEQGRANKVAPEVMQELETQQTKAQAALAGSEPPPAFSSRGEAETQAAVMNEGINSRLHASTGVTPEQSAQHFETAKELFSAQTPEEIATRAADANFNLSYYTDQPQVMAQIEAVSQQFRRAMNEAQKRPGGVPVEETIRLARQAIGGMTEREAPALIRAKLKTTEDLSAWLLASDMVMRDAGKRLSRMSEILDARPHDLVAHEEARNMLEGFYNLTRDVGGANSEVGRSLRILQERANAAERGISFKPTQGEAVPTGTNVKTQPAPRGRQKQQGPQQLTAGMTHREIAAQARMIRMADGAPRDIFAVSHGAEVIVRTGRLDKAFEVFANFLLSGPRTVQTVFASGAGLNIFEPVVRMAAGVGTMNRQLVREGADIMWGNFKYLGDNLRTMAASLRAGRSIVNPYPQHQAIGGLTGEIVRVPGRVLTAADEFARVTAYRAMVRAKSLRLARSQGLTGNALEARVTDDLRSAFDQSTGIATLPEALRYAEVPTMSGPLGRDTFGGGLQHFVNNHLEARFIAPFVRASVNIFRYAHKSVPVLNLLSKDVRAALARGGEEAAIIHARSALAGTVYGFSLYQAMAGNLTGKGPSDPQLRALWLKNHQPYSMKVGGKWVSYQRLDPLATPLGLIADLNTVIHELGDKSIDAIDMAYATVASLFYNMSSKTYIQGITRFADAWSANDPHATARWLRSFSSSLVVPQLVASANPDPVSRDVRSVMDAIVNRIPGWSDKLDPRFDLFGEPMLRTPGLLNRNQIFTVKDTGHSVEDDLFSIGRGLSPLNPKLEGGMIDLQDREAFNNGTNKTPYLRLMELLRNPVGGGSSMRDAMVELVRSPQWQDASDGTSLFPGGERWLRASAVKTKYEQRALRQVMEEYPKLREQIRLIRRTKGAAIQGGEQGVQDIESLFGSLSQ